MTFLEFLAEFGIDDYDLYLEYLDEDIFDDIYEDDEDYLSQDCSFESAYKKAEGC